MGKYISLSYQLCMKGNVLPTLKGNNSFKKCVKAYNLGIKWDICKWSITNKYNDSVHYHNHKYNKTKGITSV